MQDCASSAHPAEHGFFLRLALALIVAKLILLGVDAVPRFFLGDSGIYISAALTHVAPLDRSFVYPWLIDWLAARPRSFLPLLFAQAACGVGSALVAAIMLRRAFGLERRIVAVFALLVAISPMQLFYERMIMTECWGLLGLALMLLAGLAYLQRPRLAWLAVVAVGGILAISFRLNLLPFVLGFSFLPVLLRAFAGPSRTDPRWRLPAHLLVLAAAIALLHGGYQRIVVAGTALRPAYLVDAGFFRLALVAPAIRAEDLHDLGLREDFLDHLRPGLADPRERENQLWRNNGLIPTLRGTLGATQGSRAARKIASRIFKRDRAILVRLAIATQADYFDPAPSRARLQDDLGLKPYDPGFADWIAREFRHDMSGMPERSSPVFFAFAHSRYWLTFCLFALVPLAALILILHWRGPRRAEALLLFFSAGGLYLGHALFSHIVSFRYLHAFPWMLLIIAGAGVAAIRRGRATAQVDR